VIRPTRRAALAGGAAAGAALLLPRRPRAQAPAEAFRHGLSIFGDLKYGPDFRHFDYVNPAAPKGGVFSYTPPAWAYNQNPNTFNTMNTLILKGDAPVGLDGVFATLMVRALDEPDALYGLVARDVAVEEGGRLLRFRLRPEARFHDGSPLTAEDVAFSVNILKAEGHPLISQQMREVVGAEAVGPHELAVRFTGAQARDVPLLVAGLPILSKAYYANRPFNETTMDPPLGSSAYKVGRFDTGRSIEYERVKDWWGDALPVSVGQNNFDAIRVEFFRDRQVSLEGFKAGAYLFREEFTSRFWATQYDFPAARDGRVIRFELPDERPSGAQGFFMNTRRPQLADRRVREALILAFDFEWINANIMYGAYRRSSSFFENSDMKAVGPPTPAELALLEPFRGQVPEEVFGEPFSPPVADGTGQDRRLLRRAAELMREAGWRVDGGTLKNARGEPFALELLDDDPTFEPHALAYLKNLRILGIQGSYRVVDPAQYQSRLNGFDFDMTTRRYTLSSTPGDGLRLFFGSRTAAVPGSNNLSGIADPVVDALIERVVAAGNREELRVAARALDRVLRAGRYSVPHWFKASHWVATWDAFGRPEQKPRYGFPFDSTWWWDAEKAARAGVPSR